MNKTVFFIPLSLVGLFFTVYILLASTTNFLSVEPGYAIGEVSRWCERISGGYFREPANALSNLGFMFTGLLMFWILANEKKIKGSRFHGPTITALTYATAAVWLGPGSLLMAKYDNVDLNSLVGKYFYYQELEGISFSKDVSIYCWYIWDFKLVFRNRPWRKF